MIEWARSRSTVIDRLIAAPSLDHVVGAAKKRGWEGDAEGFGGLQVDKQLDFRDLLARQISRLGALDSSSGIDASLTVRLRETASVTHQAACGREVPRLVDSGHRVADSSHCQRSASTIRRYTSRRWTFLRIVLGIGTDGCRHAEAVKGHSRLTSTPVSAGVGCWAASVTIRSR